MGFILHLTLGIAVSFALVRGGDIVSSLSGLTSFLGLTSATLWSLGSSKVIDATGCGAYVAQNIHETADSIVAELVFAGNYCYAPGFDSSGSSSIIERLTLKVVVEEATRLHITITDTDNPRYQVPSSVVPRPAKSTTATISSSQLLFQFTKAPNPFSFYVAHKDTGERLFTTEDHPLIFTPQHWRLTTVLNPQSNIYGLGEHAETLRLPIPTNGTFTRTLWSRDSFAIPRDTNLYGVHPVYFDHRPVGDVACVNSRSCKTHTHGVFLLNSNGMDVHFTGKDGKQTLQYDVIGGIIDLYIFASTDGSPVGAAREYAKIVGTPAGIPYWSLGFHQCRYGYNDFVEVAEVVANYSKAGIPLETMWTDIDYMYERRIFTSDPQYFPVNRMRELIDHLHANGQKYVMMVDPAVGYYNQTPTGYSTLDRGTALDLWLKNGDGTPHLGVVWPGATVYPDWFHPDITTFWNEEFERFFNPAVGIDIDGVWIDMNEPASFCEYPCLDPWAAADKRGFPPKRTTPPPDPNAPIFGLSPSDVYKREISLQDDSEIVAGTQSYKHIHDDPLNLDTWSTVPVTPSNLTEEQMNNPPYNISNAAGVLGDLTAHVTAVHHNGLREYDTHNLFGTMMSIATRNAMLARRPGLKPLIITRTTFAGAGHHVGKWLGDNLSTWDHYRASIAGMLAFASLYQVPMVGSDVCGFGANTTETLCARWAMLGAFNPFYRNHNIETGISQEFYRWPLVTRAAKRAIDIRYRLLDYIYTAFHKANIDGTPILNPLWFRYPNDPSTWAVDLQFLYGGSILVSPVTEEGANSVDVYLPQGVFYDFETFKPLRSEGANHRLSNVEYTDIPLHIVGGAIIPLRAKAGNTTTIVRNEPFHLIVAPNTEGSATGTLYVDDGVSLRPPLSTHLEMEFKSSSITSKTLHEQQPEDQTGSATSAQLTIGGRFDYQPSPRLTRITLLDTGLGIYTSRQELPSVAVMVGMKLHQDVNVSVDSQSGSLTIDLEIELSENVKITVS